MLSGFLRIWLQNCKKVLRNDLTTFSWKIFITGIETAENFMLIWTRNKDPEGTLRNFERTNNFTYVTGSYFQRLFAKNRNLVNIHLAKTMLITQKYKKKCEQFGTFSYFEQKKDLLFHFLERNVCTLLIIFFNRRCLFYFLNAGTSKNWHDQLNPLDHQPPPLIYLWPGPWGRHSCRRGRGSRGGPCRSCRRGRGTPGPPRPCSREAGQPEQKRQFFILVLPSRK